MRALVLALAITCVVAAGAPRSASAGTCTISSITGLIFNPYDPTTGVAVETSGTFNVNCTALLPYTVDMGAGGSHVETARVMARTGGGTSLSYTLWQDVTHLLAWGDGLNSTTHLSGVGTGANQKLSVFGEITAHQDVQGGNYSDTVVITVNF